MTNLLSLLKIEFSKSFAGLTRRRKAGKAPTPILYVMGGLGLLAVALSCFYSFMVIKAYQQVGLDLTPVVILFAGVASMLTFVSAMNQSRGLFIGEDYDLLATLPLKKSEIIASKIINMYLLEILFSCLIMIPNAIFLLVLGNNLTLFWIDLLLAFFLPIVPIALASLVSFIFTIISARFKYGNFLYVIFNTALIFAISFLGFFNGNNNAQQKAAGFASIGNVIKWFNPSFIFLEKSLTEALYYLFIFIAINVVVAFLTSLILSLFYSKLHELVSSTTMKKKYVRKDLKIKNEFKTLLTIELKRLINSKMYFINSFMGGLMSIVSVLISLITTKDVAANAQAAPFYYLLAVPVGIGLICIVSGISNASGSSISMEGKSFWLTKTLPINYKKYMYAKLMISYILLIPPCLIASTVLVAFIHTDALSIVMAYLIPFLYVIFGGFLGLIMNVTHPKLKWKNESEVVKNSIAVFFQMLFDFIFGTILMAGLILLTLFVNPLTGYLVVLGAILLAIVLSYFILNKIFVKRLLKIEDF